MAIPVPWPCPCHAMPVPCHARAMLVYVACRAMLVCCMPCYAGVCCMPCYAGACCMRSCGYMCQASPTMCDLAVSRLPHRVDSSAPPCPSPHTHDAHTPAYRCTHQHMWPHARPRRRHNARACVSAIAHPKTQNDQVLTYEYTYARKMRMCACVVGASAELA